PHGVAELDKRVACDEVWLRADCGGDRNGRVAELLLQFEHDPLGGLLADSRDRLEARRVLEHDRTPELGRRRPGHDRERDLRADGVHRWELAEQLPLRY